MLDFFAGGIKHGDAIAGEINVAFAVNGHAIGTEFAEKGFVLERAIGLDVVTPGLAPGDVRDVQDFSIGRADDSVGLPHVIDDAGEFLVW